jgi:hypothetical protein
VSRVTERNRYGTRRKPVRNHVLLSPLVQLVSAACTAGTAIVAARQSQFVDIAAYSAGLGIAAFLAVLIGGGTSLIYVTGDDADRQAVRAVRWRFIAPAMSLFAIGFSIAYSQLTPDLPLMSIVLGGATVILNNLTGLESASLQRHGKMGLWAAATVVSKALPLIAVMIGGRYSIAMTAGALLGLIMCAALAKSFAADRVKIQMPFRKVVQKAYRPSFGLIALLDVLMLRLPFVLAPTVTDASTAGAFSTLLSAQQSITALITTGLYTIMTIRGTTLRRNFDLAHSGSERFLVLSAVPVSVIGALFASQAVSLFHVETIDSATAMWGILMLAVAPIALNRAAQYRQLTHENPMAAIRLIGVICVIIVAVCLVAIPTHSVRLLASAILIGELAGSAYVTIQWVRARSSPRPTLVHGEDPNIVGTHT